MVSIKVALARKGIMVERSDHAQLIYRQELLKGAVEATEMVLTMVALATPVRKVDGGFLAKAWQRRYLSLALPFSSEVFNVTPYGETVEKGSKPHLIRPRNKKALAFVPGAAGAMLSFSEKQGHGDAVIVRVVHHPGTKPTNFVAKTISKIESGPWPALWQRTLDRIVEKLS
jgi:hypothetical protein